MRKETLKSILWIIVALVIISALCAMWIGPGIITKLIITKLIITVAVIASLLSALIKDLGK